MAAEWVGNLFLTSGTGITLTKPDTVGHGGTTINASGSSGGGLAAWSALTTYTVGQTAVDRGGVWAATGTNLNSRPISGNTDWTLVAGTPYVDVVLDPVALTTAPFTTDGITIIAAPGAGLLTTIVQVTGFATTGDAWTSPSGSFRFGYNGPNGESIGSPGGAPEFGLFDTDPQARYLWVPFGSGINQLDQPPGANDGKNQLVAIYSGAPFAGGSRSAILRVFYQLVVASATTSSFFTISAVNQGTKTFTVSPDPTSVIANGNTITVVGSTGNNATYTVASRTATTVVVVQAIPDATADGWVKKA